MVLEYVQMELVEQYNRRDSGSSITKAIQNMVEKSIKNLWMGNVTNFSTFGIGVQIMVEIGWSV